MWGGRTECGGPNQKPPQESAVKMMVPREMVAGGGLT